MEAAASRRNREARAGMGAIPCPAQLPLRLLRAKRRSRRPPQLAELLRSRAPRRLEVRRLPARRPRSGFVRALKEREQERLRVVRCADRLVRQYGERAIP